MQGMALFATQNMPIEKFHRLLGHPSNTLMKATAEHMGISLLVETQKCETCDLVKIKAKNSMVEEPGALQKGDLLDFDLSYTGHTSADGSKYWLLIVDYWTKMKWSYFLRDKVLSLKQ